MLDGAVIVGTAAQAECDRLCVVTAPFETSVARIVARDGISAEMAARRLNAQTPESTLTAQADYVLRNDSSLAICRLRQSSSAQSFWQKEVREKNFEQTI